MRQRQRVHAAADLQRVPQRDGVEMAGAERALPQAVPIVRLGKLKRGVLGDEWPWPVCGSRTPKSSAPEPGVAGRGQGLRASPA